MPALGDEVNLAAEFQAVNNRKITFTTDSFTTKIITSSSTETRLDLHDIQRDVAASVQKNAGLFTFFKIVAVARCKSLLKRQVIGG